MFLLFYILTCIYVTQAKVKVTNMGIQPMTRGDGGLIFYATLHNVGEIIYLVHVRMIKCCEVLEDQDMDCEMMKLLGGDMGHLYADGLKNVTLLFPNMYIHNRKGKCLICFKYTTPDNSTIQSKETIKFDTFIREPKTNSILLKDYYKKSEFAKCQTIDQDPLDKCEPVNCQMKYLGFRNFFNTRWQRCQKVPICVSDPSKSLPDVAYIPISNMCMDMENVIRPHDLKFFEEGQLESEYSSTSAAYISSASLRCHHGHLNNKTGLCICDVGWMSALHDKEQYEPSLGVYHMCNVQISTWNEANRTKIRMTMIVITVLGAVIAVSTVMVALICHLLYRFVRSDPNKPPSRIASKIASRLSSLGSHKSFSKMFKEYTSTNKSSTSNETENIKSNYETQEDEDSEATVGSTRSAHSEHSEDSKDQDFDHVEEESDSYTNP